MALFIAEFDYPSYGLMSKYEGPLFQIHQFSLAIIASIGSNYLSYIVKTFKNLEIIILSLLLKAKLERRAIKVITYSILAENFYVNLFSLFFVR